MEPPGAETVWGFLLVYKRQCPTVIFSLHMVCMRVPKKFLLFKSIISKKYGSLGFVIKGKNLL